MIIYLPDSLKVSLPFLSLSAFLCFLNLHRDYFFRDTDQRFTIKMKTVYEKSLCGKINLMLGKLLFLKDWHSIVTYLLLTFLLACKY